MAPLAAPLVERLADVLDTTAVALVGVNTHGLTVVWNHAAETLFGWSASEVLGRTPPIVPESLSQEWRLQMRQVLEGGRGAAAAETLCQHRQGRLIPILRSSSPLRDRDGAVVGMLESLMDITAHKQLDEESRAWSQVRERELIAMDLHDGLIQSLYAVCLGLSATFHDENLDLPAARTALDHTRQELEFIIDEARHYLLDLRAREFTPSDLAAGLRILLDGLRLNARVQPHVDIDPLVNDRLEPWARGHVLYIAREAISNILRHARASEVSVSIQVRGDSVRLMIHDNGQGFDPDIVNRQGRHGLGNIVSRARLIGGRLSLTSQPGRGTELHLEVPAPRRTTATD